MSVKVVEGKADYSVLQKVKDYQMLVKFRLTATVVFSSVIAFLIASEGAINWVAVVILAAGGFLVTGAANTLNQVLEKDFDKLMKRTADRPLAAGRMKDSEAVLAAGLMSLAGILLLALFNPWTAFFGMVALLSYAFLYTPMKRISPIAVIIGAVPGALPTLIGCAAAEGTLTLLALSLFTLQFLWQFPHFWSIGWLGFEDYQKAGYKIVPTLNGKQDPSIGLQSLLYALFLVPVAFLPWYLGVSGIVSAVLVALLGLVYAGFSWNFYKKSNRKSALLLMFFSFFYIPISLIAFLADKV
ncbi:MAG: protoheme IX farnesyltransferase [Saprospiraceae bacterium]|nr:MAG: protoheme IX farnesyltransferase [Saprospiraceae bacterium]